jgi:hypothetical protein
MMASGVMSIEGHNPERPVRLVPVESMFFEEGVIAVGATVRFRCADRSRGYDITHAWDSDRWPEVWLGCPCGSMKHHMTGIAVLI